MGSDDKYTSSMDFVFGSPNPDTGEVDHVEVEIENNETDIRLRVDNLEFIIEDDTFDLNTLGDGSHYEFTLPGFTSVKEEDPICPNYYCENYAADCEKHDEKGNTV